VTWMLYIHELKDLNRKSADIEVTQLVRDIKKVQKQPLTAQALHNHLSQFYISKTDVDVMSRALDIIPDTVKMITALSKSGGPYAVQNLKRAVSTIQEMPVALSNNITYGQRILDWQQSMAAELASLFNQIPKLTTDAQKKAHDRQLTDIFQMILRNPEFVFNYKDIINEAHTLRMKSLQESIDKGFFFQVKLEEHLKGEQTKEVPPGHKQAMDTILKNLSLIRESIDRAYEHNLRMVSLAVMLYAYVKWVSAKA
jgi:hypothetical protein